MKAKNIKERIFIKNIVIFLILVIIRKSRLFSSFGPFGALPSDPLALESTFKNSIKSTTH
jgi:hypothetical protein